MQSTNNLSEIQASYEYGKQLRLSSSFRPNYDSDTEVYMRGKINTESMPIKKSSKLV